MFIYPGNLVSKLRKLWPLRVPEPLDQLLDPISDQVLQDLLEVTYHSTFHTEEGRRVGFRAIFSSHEQIEVTNPGATICFSAPRKFSVGEIYRLAPATDPSRVAIGIAPDASDVLQVWGLVDCGSAHQDFNSGFQDLTGNIDYGDPPPPFLTVSAIEPGSLSVTCGPASVLNLREGRLLEPANILAEGPVATALLAAIAGMRQEAIDLYRYPVASLETIGQVYMQYLKKVLLRIRDKAHGGTLLVIPEELVKEDPTLGGRLRIKYASTRSRTRRLVLESLILRDRYTALRKKSFGDAGVPQALYEEVFSLYERRAELDAALSNSVSFLAGLSAVDGAVVITDRFRLLGFGAMIIVPSLLRQVSIAFDSNGECNGTIGVESYGARHGAAFRLCESLDIAVAFVVSQDGGVKAVKKLEDKVVLWEDVDLSL
jgi:hypothetical protein